MNEPVENTDKEIWREIEGEYYCPKIFVTEQNAIGIDVGGHVYVKTVYEWHQQADRIAELEKELSWWRTNFKLPTEPNSPRPNWLYAPQTKPLSNAELDIEIVKFAQGKHDTMRDMLRAIEAKVRGEK